MNFSVLVRCLLLCACLLPAAAQSATPPAATILVFGDSLSAAYGLPREAGWAHLLQQALRQRPTHRAWNVVNASVSGETTSGGRSRIAAALRQHQPAIVLLELGANDGLRGTPLSETEANLAAIIRQAQAANARVILLGMRLPPNYGEAYATQFEQLYPKLARQHHTALVPFLLDGVAPDQFQADNLHPVAAAQPRVLQNVMRQLEGMLD